MKRRSYQTMEFWLSVAAVVLGGVMASGAFDSAEPGSTVAIVSKVIGSAVSLLAAAGYTGARIMQKIKQGE